MYKQKLGFIALTLLLVCAQATAGDPAPAAKDAHAAPAKESPKEAAPAKDAHAKDAHAAAPKDAHAAEPKEAAKGAAKDAKEVKEASKEAAPAKDAHAADSHDAAASKDEPKPVARKAKRKKPKAEAKAQAKGHGDAKASADHHADAAPAVPASIAPTTRVRPRDRAAATSAVEAEQSTGAHDGYGDSHGDGKHAGSSAAAPASAKQDTHSTTAAAHQADTHAAPAAAAKQDAHSAKPDDAHHTDPAPPVPSNLEPTPRQRVKAPAATAAAPSATAHADTAAHDDHHAADAHGKSSHAAPDAKLAAKEVGGHDAKHDVKSHDAQAASTHAGDECNLPLKAEIAALFDRWNTSLRTGDPKKVVANYAPDSVLLPTVSNRARFTIAEKEDYFMHFLQRRPQGYIDDRMIDVDCNSATDAGLYTFRFADGSSVKARYSFSYKKINGQWLITSHHSSGMPEKPEAPQAAHADTHAAPKSSDSGSSTKGWVRFP